MRRVLIVTVVACLTLGGCASKRHSSSVASPPGGTAETTSTRPPTATAAEPPTTALAGASSSPVSVPDRTPTAVLTAVRIAHQPGFDRVVFEFAGSARGPGYVVARKTGQPVQDGSGKPVTVSGNAYLLVRMADASEADPANGHAVYTGSTRITPPDTTTVTEVVAVGDFEGVLSWAVGLRGAAVFRVSEVGSPTRLVVDVAAT